jgi:hypothetical protein
MPDRDNGARVSRVRVSIASYPRWRTRALRLKHLGYPPAITEDGEMMISDRTEELLDQMRSQLIELKPDQVWVVEDIMLKFRKSLEQ